MGHISQDEKETVNECIQTARYFSNTPCTFKSLVPINIIIISDVNYTLHIKKKIKNLENDRSKLHGTNDKTLCALLKKKL